MRRLRSGLWVATGLVLPALLAAGCGVKAPILALDGLRVGDMGITGVALDVRFRVRNPNPEPLTIERMEYELFVNGNRLDVVSTPRGCRSRASARGRWRAGSTSTS